MKTSQIALFAAVVCSTFVAIRQSAAQDCAGYTKLEKTIYVPQIEYETRTITCVECQPYTEEYTETVNETVYKTRMEEQQDVMEVPETRYRIKCDTVRKPQFEDQTECYMKSVATKITWKGTETVVKEVPRKISRVITEDKGHWEERACATCSKCKKKKCSCAVQCTQRVWCPNIVTRTVDETVMEKVTKEVPRTYTKTCYKMVPATRTKQCFSCYKPETIQRKEGYTVNVCRQVTKQVPVTETECKPVQKKRTRTVMAQTTVEKEIKVPVCTLVPMTISCDIPTVSTCLDTCQRWMKGKKKGKK